MTDNYAEMNDDAFEALLSQGVESNEEQPSAALIDSDVSVDESTDYGAESLTEAPEADLTTITEEETQYEETQEADEQSEEAGTETQSDVPATTEGDDPLKELFAPFKASGRDFQVKSVEEAKRLMQMGVDYSNKVQGFKEHRKTIKTLEANGIDADKLAILIDASKGNKQAIAKLAQAHDIDVMDLTTEDDNYTPSDYSVSDASVELDDVIARIQGSDSFTRTSDVVSNQWDSSSRELIFKTPALLEALNAQMSDGTYDRVMAEVNRMRVFGGLQGLSDIHAYSAVGKQQAAAAPQTPTVAPAARVVPKAVLKAGDAERKIRVSPNKGKDTATTTGKPNYATMNDADFEKLLNDVRK